mmetsp:Transcript_6813/g.10317  ORF Transcript_6813/g.10317 Transcript_6813/m.10317 type:complete len:82 (-) Transcript_6813:1188-1433(-)
MILTACQRLGLEIIDNRSCHPRGIDTTMVNKIYASDPDGLQGCESVVYCCVILAVRVGFIFFLADSAVVFIIDSLSSRGGG